MLIIRKFSSRNCHFFVYGAVFETESLFNIQSCLWKGKALDNREKCSCASHIIFMSGFISFPNIFSHKFWIYNNGACYLVDFYCIQIWRLFVHSKKCTCASHIIFMSGFIFLPIRFWIYTNGACYLVDFLLHSNLTTFRSRYAMPFWKTAFYFTMHNLIWDVTSALNFEQLSKKRTYL